MINRSFGRIFWIWSIWALLCLPGRAQETPPGDTTQQGQGSGQTTAPESDAGIINESQLVGLPLNGRSYSQLATLEGGVSDPFGGGKQGGGSGGLTVSGGRGEWNSFLLDGTDINGANNQVPRSAAGGQLGADTTAQVQVFSTNYAAQYGRAAGGVLNAVSRSGSNDLHGTFFEFLRNSKVDARNFFDSGPEPPPFKRNQFGGTVSGPVKRDRFFFMAGFEILKNRLTETYVSKVPDQNARNGLVPGDQPGGLETVTIDPRVMPYLKLFPVPDQSITGREQENRTAVSLPADEYFFVTRIDQHIGDSDALFFRYTFDDASTRVVGEGSPTFPTRSDSRQQYLTFAHTHFFSPRLLNSLRLGYTRPVVRAESEALTAISESLYFVSEAPQFGRIDLPGLTPFGPDPLLPSSKVMNTYQITEDLLWNRGRHSIRTGLQFIRFQWNVFDNASASGEWTFSSMKDFLTLEKEKFDNNATEGTTDLRVALPPFSSDRAFRQSLLGLYVQDSFRMLPNFTVNLGLRYEFASIVSDTRGRTVFLNDELKDTDPQVGPLMSKNPSLRNFAPRIGLSWSPDRDAKTLISAGFGIYFDQLSEYMIDGKRNTPPFVTQVARTNYLPFASGLDAEEASIGATASRQVRIFEYQNPKVPTVYRYHLNVQQELLPGLSASAAYVGARGNHLVRRYESNLFPPAEMLNGRLFLPPDAGPLNPNFSSIDRSGTDTQSFYNSMLLSFSRSPWNGLSVDASYTLAKAIDEGSSAGNFTRHYGFNRKLDRSLAFFHVTHRFVLNYFYNLPIGSGQRWGSSGWLSHLFGNWRVGGIFNLRTGLATDPFYRISEPGYLFVSSRADLAPGASNNPIKGVTTCDIGPDRPAGDTVGTRELYFDPCSFIPPEPGRIGNAGRNIIVGPRVATLDLSLQKEFAIDSERSLQLRVEFFNLPNHTNFAEPDDDSTAIFLDSDGTRNPEAGRLNSTATNSRQIQFALRFSF